MKKLKPLPKKIPHFASYEEEANFWDTHDTSPLIRKKNLVLIEYAKPMKHLISFRIDVHLLSGIQTLAAKRHIPYQTLIHSWLAEKLRDEFRKSA
jgi:predicted DNA binding CopG/RHH family protein